MNNKYNKKTKKTYNVNTNNKFSVDSRVFFKKCLK